MSVLIVSCSTLGPEDLVRDPSAPVQTHLLEYRLADNGIGNYELTIPWAYTNSGSTPVYYHPCSSRLEKKVDERWRRAFQTSCPLAGSLVDTIPSGAQFAGSFSIHACYVKNCEPRFSVTPIPGTYRVIPGFYARIELQSGSYIPRDSLSVADRRSNDLWLYLP